MHHISRDENIEANDLVQQASGFRSNRGKFSFLKILDVLVYQTEQSDFRPMCSAIICSAESGLAKLDGPVFETRGSKISRILDESKEMTTIDPNDWRTPWYII
jgi:hypothetical protein